MISILLNKNHVTDINTLNIEIKKELACILIKEFKYSYRYVQNLFNRGRTSIHKWVKEKDLKDITFTQASLGYKINTDFIDITTTNKSIEYIHNNIPSYQYSKESIKTDLISGHTIRSILEDDGIITKSKSTIGCLRQEVFLKYEKCLKLAHKDIVKNINKTLSYSKPLFLSNEQNKMFIWDEAKLTVLINKFYIDGYSLTTILYILKNSYIELKNKNHIKLKQENQFLLLACLWTHMDKEDKKLIVLYIKEVFKNKNEYSNQMNYMDFYSVFSTILFNQNSLEHTQELQKLVKEEAKKAIRDKLYFVKHFPLNILKKTYLHIYLNSAQSNIQNQTVLGLYVNLAKSVLNQQKFKLVYQSKKPCFSSPDIYYSKIKNKLENYEENKEYNIYYSKKHKKFLFKDIHKLKHSLITTHTMTLNYERTLQYKFSECLRKCNHPHII